MIGSSHFYVGVSLVPQNTTTPSTGGDIRFNSSTNKLELYTTTLDPIVTEAGTATLTNKVLSGNTAATLISGSGTLTLNTTGTITVPNATDTLVARNTTDTLTNKTLSGNTATNLISGSGTLTLNTTGTITVPNATDTLVGKATTDTLSNKTLGNTTVLTLKDSNFTVQDDGDTTKQLQLQLSGITTATTRTLTVPDANTTIVGTDATQTLTNKTLSGNTAVTLISGAGTLTLNTSGTITVPSATDTLVGRATTDTLTNKTLSGNTAVTLISGSGTLTLNTTGTVTIPNGTDTLVARTSTDTLTNKTFGDAITGTQISTPSNPASGKDKLYFKSDDNLYTLNSSGIETQVGSGSGGNKNYLGTVNNVNGNGNFETGTTTGWSLGTIGTLTNNLPTGSPTFGSGASGNLSISAVTSGKLAGSYSLSYASSAATTQGNMLASNAFTLDIEDQAKVLTFKFYYSATSNPANANWSGTSSNSFAVAVYDVTNSVFLPQSANFGMTQSSGVGYCTGTFQTGSSTASVRFIVYNANATSGAATVLFDDFFVGPQTAPYGPVMTDWVSYTPTFTGFGTPSAINFQSRRVGDTLEVRGTFTNGTPTATEGRISLGFNGADSSVTTLSTLPTLSNVGRWADNSSSSTTDFRGRLILIEASKTYFTIGAENSTAGGSLVKQNGNGVSAAGAVISIFAQAPISGWSSNVQMSNDTDTRVVAAQYYVSTNYSVTANQAVNFDTKIIDTHGAVTTGSANTWKFTAPVSGTYEVILQVLSNSGQTPFIYKNGSSYAQIFTISSTSQNSGGILINLSAGDYISYNAQSTSTITGAALTSGPSIINIKRLSGPSVIAATESVSASYGLTSAVTPGANAVVKYDTKIKDTHNAFSTSTGLYTAPTSGTYQVFITVLTTTTTSNLYIKVNGTAQGVLTTGDGGIARGGATIYPLNAGDTIGIYQETSAALTATSGSLGYFNKFSIARIGN